VASLPDEKVKVDKVDYQTNEAKDHLPHLEHFHLSQWLVVKGLNYSIDMHISESSQTFCEIKIKYYTNLVNDVSWEQLGHNFTAELLVEILCDYFGVVCHEYFFVFKSNHFF